MRGWLRSFPYFLKEALSGMGENAGVALLSIATTVISLVFLGGIWIAVVNVSRLTADWSERFQLTVYLSEEVTLVQRAAVRRALLKNPAVERVEEVSSEAAVEQLRRQLGADASLLAKLDGKFLPSSLRVILKPDRRDIAHIESLRSSVRLLPGVERARNDLGWLRRLEGAIRFLRLTGLMLSFLLGLGVVFIIANTIRLTLYGRKEEITIMHLVGATDFFIRTPFVIEGMICGAVGGIFASIALWVVFFGLFQPIVWRFAIEGVALSSGGWTLGLGLTFTGMGLGFLGSAISVTQVLHERE